MNTLKVHYTDGSSYITSANATPEEFYKYLTQCGPHICTHEDPETGKETYKTIAAVELIGSGPARPRVKDVQITDDSSGTPATISICRDRKNAAGYYIARHYTAKTHRLRRLNRLIDLLNWPITWERRRATAHRPDAD